MFRPDVGLGLSGANAEKQVAQDASEANAERLVAKDDAKAERLVADDAKAERLVADGANAERLVAHPEEKLNIDIQVVSSLSEWDTVVADGIAVGCMWYIGMMSLLVYQHCGLTIRLSLL